MITAYQRECMTAKVKPIQILLDQLKVIFETSLKKIISRKFKITQFVMDRR